MDSLFFIFSKVLRPFLSPSTWLIILPLLAWLVGRIGWKKCAKTLWVLEIFSVLMVGFYPVGQWLVKPLENFSSLPDVAQEPSGIIVLGGAWLTEQSNYWNHWELNQAAERELAFIALARKYPDAKLVFTGGSGKLLATDFKEADVAQWLYRDMGLDLSRITFEAESRNTYENGVFSKQLMKPTVDENWWLITSAYHMPRSIGVFCKLGWRMTPYPVDHFYKRQSWIPRWGLADHLWVLDRVFQEWVGLFVYRLTGKSDSILKQNC